MDTGELLFCASVACSQEIRRSKCEQFVFIWLLCVVVVTDHATYGSVQLPHSNVFCLTALQRKDK